MLTQALTTELNGEPRDRLQARFGQQEANNVRSILKAKPPFLQVA